MKMFGLELFNHNRPTHLYDFAQHGIVRDAQNDEFGLMRLVVEKSIQELNGTGKKNLKKMTKKRQTIQLTPKGVFEAKALNTDTSFKIITDEAYIDKTIAELKEKLTLLGKEPKANSNAPMSMEYGAIAFGRTEIKSMITRLENRRKMGKAAFINENYPYTTNDLISGVLKKNSNLRLKIAKEFVPDFPTEAIRAMKDYNAICKDLCGLETHFYVIADKKDFGEVSKRRDPILLAQSPFGFFWNVLGAWDDEMMYLGDL